MGGLRRLQGLTSWDSHDNWNVNFRFKLVDNRLELEVCYRGMVRCNSRFCPYWTRARALVHALSIASNKSVASHDTRTRVRRDASQPHTRQLTLGLPPKGISDAASDKQKIYQRQVGQFDLRMRFIHMMIRARRGQGLALGVQLNLLQLNHLYEGCKCRAIQSNDRRGCRASSNSGCASEYIRWHRVLPRASPVSARQFSFTISIRGSQIASSPRVSRSLRHLIALAYTTPRSFIR